MIPLVGSVTVRRRPVRPVSLPVDVVVRSPVQASDSTCDDSGVTFDTEAIKSWASPNRVW